MCRKFRLIKTRKSGFTLIELAVSSMLVLAVVAVMIPVLSHGLLRSSKNVARIRGRDIYVAITGANTEREPLGLPSVWPLDNLSTNPINEKLDRHVFDFDNSTDYFKCLCDEENMGTEQWSPFVSGFDYSRLAGAGVPVCEDGKLTAECNMWTVAKNITDETPDFIPVLATRNIDASSFTANLTTNNMWRLLRFDPRWPMPYRDKMGCVIRKDGSAFPFLKKHATYRVIYGDKGFCLDGGTNGVRSVSSLKYLTPDSEVELGERAYVEGAERVARNQAGLGLVLKNEYFTTKKWRGLTFACVTALIYVLIAVLLSTRLFSRFNPPISRLDLMTGVLHWFVTNLYIAFDIVLAVEGWKSFVSWFFVFVVLLHMVVVFGLRLVRTESDSQRNRCMKWLVAAPLILWLMPAGGFVVLSLFVLSLSVGKLAFWCLLLLLAVALIAYLRNLMHRIKKNI